MTVQLVGRGGFTGSAITSWCYGCGDYSVRDDEGRCLWPHDGAPAEGDPAEPVAERSAA